MKTNAAACSSTSNYFHPHIRRGRNDGLERTRLQVRVRLLNYESKLRTFPTHNYGQLQTALAETLSNELPEGKRLAGARSNDGRNLEAEQS